MEFGSRTVQNGSPLGEGGPAPLGTTEVRASTGQDRVLDAAAAALNGTPVSIPRRYTRPGVNPLDEVVWTKRKSVIADPDGTVVFRLDDCEVPESWSQLATDVAVSKYFRKAGVPVTGHEKSVRQLVERVAKTIRHEGVRQGLLSEGEVADAFEAELSYMLVNQVGAFNSPVWFNCGLWHVYGIAGSGGNFAWDETLEKVVETADAYSRPQVSACFIQSVDDDLGSIFDLVKNESRVFKYGSGTGTNFSRLRGDMEKLSGGGLSSGLLSFLEVLDRGAGATKSGGTTRRAAKMVIVDIDHPEVDKFITWKKREERKVAALIAAGYSSDFNGEAYRTVAGQNSNNSVRISDAFMKAVENDGDWSTTLRSTGEVNKTFKARELWRMVADASWHCADPGIQFDDTVNAWHTCKATDRIYASNPCSEYMFLDDTACNLASINLLKYLDEEGRFDTEGFRHACRTFFLAQEIMVDLASYPTAKIAQRSHEYRTLGLGYANLGTLLMVKGLPYDSDEGRNLAAAITSLMTGEAFALSAEMAAVKGPFAGYRPNRASMLGVMQMHSDAAEAIPASGVQEDLLAAARECWQRAIAEGQVHGFRNAQSTVLAPTGTIGLLMDCDTTGVEPDFALVKFKKLAGGGYFKIVNQSVPRALKALGYDAAAVEAIINYAVGTCTLAGAPHINHETLKAKGFLPGEIASVERALKGVLDLKQAFAPHVVGANLLERIGVPVDQRANFKFDVLGFLGFSKKEIHEANDVVCGRQTVEGAPGIQPRHLAVFDCANRCGPYGERYIEPRGHVRMMAAVQPFLSGAISKTINLPKDATVQDVEDIHFDSWKLGLKAIALYRDGCKLSQPLSVKEKDKEETKASAPTAVAAKPAASQLPAAAQNAVADLMSKAVEQLAAAIPQNAVAVRPQVERERLPGRRKGITQEARIGGFKLFLRTGEYKDGRLGEIFIDMHKEGAAYRSMLNCFAMLTSMALQYGVPLEVLVDQFVFTRFEPQGPVKGHDRVKFATSVIDFVFRSLAVEYLGRDDLAHVPAEESEATPLTATSDVPALRAQAIHTTTPVLGESAPEAPQPAAEPHLTRAEKVAANKKARGGSAQDALLGELGGDAPFCDTCGHITVRNGACFKCLNCGTSMGCS
jgi:ribonucleoside-diphosphate reductase alpha chain